MIVTLLVALVAAVVSFLMSVVMWRVGIRYRLYPEIRARDVHTRPTPRLGGVAMLAGFALALTACGGGSDPLSSGSGQTSGAATPSDTIVVGSANFTESQILAEIYAQALAAKGVTIEKRLNIGSREAYIPALQDGSIDLIPEYTGVLLQYFDKAADETEPDAVYTALQAALPSNLIVLDKSAAEDKDAEAYGKAQAKAAAEQPERLKLARAVGFKQCSKG